VGIHACGRPPVEWLASGDVRVAQDLSRIGAGQVWF
jgi:hypothetical protein